MLGVAVLGAIVHTRESGGSSFESALDSDFLTAGAVTPACAVLTGLWLTAEGSGGRAVGEPPLTASPGRLTC